MSAEIYWTNEFLATMPHPLGGDKLEGEIRSLKQAGVDIIVSMLEDHEISRLGLEKEVAICIENEIIYANFPILDRTTPRSFEDVHQFVKELLEQIRQNKKIAIHCFAGIGRSSLIACCLLVLQGADVDDAFGAISKARGYPVPDTIDQLNWAYTFAEKYGETR